ncbi:zf-TFIIB domain-containing protein [Hamadaea sp. NPDC051192]|uniref:TFIIB-type zinc ribbon-containing protein n=1 Tax=Hamadaea sp. NPDC051192 TaxID=3154940 RepID=UPI00343BADF0
MQQMTCPKCQGAMRQYERSGVVVDQCSECRGIFLDRGELEKLVDAENSFHGSAQPAQTQPQPPQYQQQAPQHQQQYQQQQYQQQHYQQPRYEERRYGSDGYGHDYHHKKKKKGSFFEELFD